MKNITSIDHRKVMQSAQTLKANPPLPSEITKDPIAFLEAQGITVGADIEAMIKAKGMFPLAKAPRQAGILHIDI
ncbi:MULTISPECIES: hypothetical protein [Pseudomonas]|uniref:Uncharacterized protein n=1 Tax=Pseudomonas wuhanensis TaxID=2954098 RepID=A0ABY9GUF7_9PSED|nr:MULTISPECIES: hypothetical protein [unclassified Pseudomonas]WLI13453.1 hypothetical protein PSH65_04650 [Pseudomonas sp. FP603]WLI19340.1 hypothetical protein PSH88_04650 [Pseudomonas sp. FP607]